MSRTMSIGLWVVFGFVVAGAALGLYASLLAGAQSTVIDLIRSIQSY